jgi:hypothetical protein
MDFSYTTLGWDTTAQANNAGHPSMFQNPAMDLLMLSDIEKAKTSNPQDLWEKTLVPSHQMGNNAKYVIVLPNDPNDPPFTLSEKENIIRKLDPITEKTLNNVQPTLLFSFFFSRENLATLQKDIRYVVNKWSGHHIGDQSETELHIIMQKVYKEHARMIDETRAGTKALLRHIQNQLKVMNEVLVNEVAPIVINGVEQHMGYIKQVDQPRSALSLARPMDTKITGTQQYRSISSVQNAEQVYSMQTVPLPRTSQGTYTWGTRNWG